MNDLEFFWRVDSLEWDVVHGGIVTAHWSVVATDGETEGTASSRTLFSPDPEDPSFISIKDITEAQVLSWITKNFADVQIEHYEKQAKNAYVRAKLPPLVTGLPWKQPFS